MSIEVSVLTLTSSSIFNDSSSKELSRSIDVSISKLESVSRSKPGSVSIEESLSFGSSLLIVSPMFCSVLESKSKSSSEDSNSICSLTFSNSVESSSIISGVSSMPSSNVEELSSSISSLVLVDENSTSPVCSISPSELFDSIERQKSS